MSAYDRWALIIVVVITKVWTSYDDTCDFVQASK